MIEVTDTIEPWRLTDVDDKQVVVKDTTHGKEIFVAGYDYYESGNVPYSGVRLNREELQQLLALLDG